MAASRRLWSRTIGFGAKKDQQSRAEGKAHQQQGQTIEPLKQSWRWSSEQALVPRDRRFKAGLDRGELVKLRVDYTVLLDAFDDRRYKKDDAARLVVPAEKHCTILIDGAPHGGGVGDWFGLSLVKQSNS